jgi:hypothetical protein
MKKPWRFTLAGPVTFGDRHLREGRGRVQVDFNVTDARDGSKEQLRVARTCMGALDAVIASLRAEWPGRFVRLWARA